MLVHIFIPCLAYKLTEDYFLSGRTRRCTATSTKISPVCCKWLHALYYWLWSLITFANYSANATLLINWHFPCGLNRICTVPYWLIYQLFIDDVHCCAPLLNHYRLYVASIIKLRCTFWFLCFSIVIASKTLLLAYTCPMGRLLCCCMQLVTQS